MWKKLNVNQVLYFPRLDLNYLKELTISIYQLNFTPAYIRDKVIHDGSEIFELDEHRNESGFIRVRLYSCFRNALSINYGLLIELIKILIKMMNP